VNRLTIFPCYAAADLELARELSGFLERGAPVDVFFNDGEIRGRQTLLSKAAEGLQADLILVLLSPDSVPERWILDQWKPALWEISEQARVSVACLLACDCRFPELLRRRNFFDLTKNRLEGFRALKQWVLKKQPPPQELFFAPAPLPGFAGGDPELDQLRQSLSDTPGHVVLRSEASGALAREFAGRHREDFQGLFWICCGSHTPARLAGDLAAELGLRLEGQTQDNLKALRRFCAERRCLIVLEGAEPETVGGLIPGGMASVLITTGAPEDPTEAAADPGATQLGRLYDAIHEALSNDWMLACRLGNRMASLARDHGRLAEADELLDLLIRAAEQRGDRRALADFAWERSWILERWDRLEEARALADYGRVMAQDQLSFDW